MNAGSPRALIYVQHLLGIGHLARIRRVATALVAAGVATTVVQGGPDADLMAPSGVETCRLTPVRVAASDMSSLLHDDGQPFTSADKDARRDCLLELLDEVKPDILIIEAFPFGRRQMRFELVPLLEAARERDVAVIASSIRDLLQETRKPGRAEETCAAVQRWFDLVLVHGEERLTPLSLTFPLAESIASRIHYTGLVGPAFPPMIHRDHGVVVSAGGGVVGRNLLEAAIAAAPLSSCTQDNWLVLTGPNLPDSDFSALAAMASASPVAIDLRRSVPDLAAHLAGARLSISQAGYNTVADLLSVSCAAVLCPYASGGETEQSTRAAALARAGRVAVVLEDRLTPEVLAAAMAQALRLPRAAPRALDGGARTAALLLEALGRKRHIKTRGNGGNDCYPCTHGETA